MSAALYCIRLYWDAGRGCARHGDVHLELHEPPLGPAVATIDYAPEVSTFLIREQTSGVREMTPGERECCAALLIRIETAAKAALKG